MDAATCELAALVALLRRRSGGWPEVAHEIHDAGSALDALRSQVNEPDTLFGTGSLDRELAMAGDQIEAWRAEGLGIHAFFDADYPAQLLGIKEMPPVLFSRGALYADDRAVAVVGSRRATDNGLRIARTVAASLVSRGVTVASGLAEGIDTAAHTAALAAGGRTVAVVGTGIQRFYPSGNRELQRQIGEAGLVISQFWPDAGPTKHSFPMRNAVMSGYSAATVVVEAGERSGARIQARLALHHGRPVVLTDLVMQCEWAKAFAENPGVYVVRGSADLETALEEILRLTPTEAGLENFPDLAIR